MCIHTSTQIQSHQHTDIYTHMQNTHTHAQTWIYMHTYIHRQTDKYTRMHARTHTHIHTHTLWKSSNCTPTTAPLTCEVVVLQASPTKSGTENNLAASYPLPQNAYEQQIYPNTTHSTFHSNYRWTNIHAKSKFMFKKACDTYNKLLTYTASKSHSHRQCVEINAKFHHGYMKLQTIPITHHFLYLFLLYILWITKTSVMINNWPLLV